MNYDSEILVTEIAPVGEQSTTLFIRLGEILYIDSHEPRKNYVTPRFVTREGSYRPALTIKECCNGVPEFIRLERGVLVNRKEVEYIADHTYAAYAHFKDSTLSVAIARTHLRYLRKWVRLID